MNHRIKDLIKERGYTQQEFADKLGITRVGLSQLINGKPSYSTLEKISAALEVPMWQLFASPEEVTGKGELTALIQHKGAFYKASTIEELEKIVNELKGE
ncbi:MULTISPECIES: helix-turn-helix domain-containing protein [unclassified Bacteroides]|uniref:helix-turn-helix domain-containing protein n=1 Tax=unclassified Bacteroides TaxID=2646097 RepID=UPI004063AC5C